MQIPDEVRQCVVFLYSKHDEELVPRGTGFIVTVPSNGTENFNYFYLVAARHVIDGIKLKGTDGMVHVRLNTVTGGVDWEIVSADRFVTHPDPDQCVDVAVLPWMPSREIYEYKVVTWEMIVTDQSVATHGIGIGDEIFTTGLFVNHLGQKRNIPIVRIGNIAAMPDELVETELGSMVAYLAEARSVGGLSGSPVFVTLGPVRQTPEGGTTLSQRVFLLLGLMQGHWHAPYIQTDSTTRSDFEKELVNMGIAIVVPSQKIIEVINHPQLLGVRQVADLALKSLPKESPERPEADQPTTQP